MDAIQYLQRLVAKSRGKHSMTSKDFSLLVGFLLRLLEDEDVFVSKTTLVIMSSVVEHASVDLEPHVDGIVAAVIEKLGEHTIYTQAGTRALISLMKQMKPKAILEAMAHLNHPDLNVSEEALNVLIVALLTFKAEDFDFTSLLAFLTQAIDGEDHNIGNTALEAIAIVNRLAGTSFPALLSRCAMGQGSRNRIDNRLKNPAVASLASDGTIQHAWSSNAIQIDGKRAKSGGGGGHVRKEVERGKATKDPKASKVATLRERKHAPLKGDGVNSNGSEQAGGEGPTNAHTLPTHTPRKRLDANALKIEVPKSHPRSIASQQLSTHFDEYDGPLSTRSDVTPLPSTLDHSSSSENSYSGRDYEGNGVANGNGANATTTATAHAHVHVHANGGEMHSSGVPEGARYEGMRSHPITKYASSGGSNGTDNGTSYGNGYDRQENGVVNGHDNGVGQEAAYLSHVSSAHTNGALGSGEREHGGLAEPSVNGGSHGGSRSIRRSINFVSAELNQGGEEVSRHANAHGQGQGQQVGGVASFADRKDANGRGYADLANLNGHGDGHGGRYPRGSYKRLARPARMGRPESMSSVTARGGKEGSAEPSSSSSSRPGSELRGMVVDKLNILKRRQESRRANSANAVLQRAKSDPALSCYASEALQVNSGSIYSSSSLCPPPNKFSTPRIMRSGKGKDRNQAYKITVQTNAEDNSGTFAPGGISTPKSFRSRNMFQNGENVRSPMCRLVSSKYDKSKANGLGDMGKPLEFTTAELQPCLDPDGTLKDVLNALAIANAANRKELNWIAQYEAITNARRLVVCHSSVILPHLHNLAIAVIPALMELRSYTVKNAFLLLSEMAKTLKGYVDPELERFVPVLCKRAGETSTAGRNNFLTQEADQVLSDIVRNCSEIKSAQALLNCANHKSGAVRTKVIMHLNEVVTNCTRRLLQSKDTLDRIMTTAAKFLDEPSIEARTYSKRLLWTLGQNAEHSMRTFLHKISDMNAKQVRNVLSNPPPALPVPSGSRGVAKPVSRGNTPTLSNCAAEGKQFQSLNGVSSRDRRYSKSREKPTRKGFGGSALGTDDDPLEGVVGRIGSKDWRDRCQGIQEAQHMMSAGDVGEVKLIPVFDALIPRLSDGNSKVVVQTLKSIGAIVKHCRNNAVVVLNNLMPALATTLGSTNEKIRLQASASIKVLCKEVDSVYLVQNLAHCATHCGPRSKGLLVENLCNVVYEAYQKKPQYVVKYVLPVAFLLLNEKSSGTRMSVQKLVHTLHNVMGTSLLDQAANISPHTQSRLHEILTSSYY